MPYKDPLAQKEYQRRHYRMNKSSYAASRRATVGRNEERVRRIKENSPCADCGNHFPYYVMHFDHIGDDKLTNISRLVYHDRASWSKIQDEMDKCELVCANCHAERTYRRRMD